METNFKKLSGASAIKKSKNDHLRNKTLTRNIRSSIDRRYSSREIPPLTPLHRLKRFKAIRDKNLYKNKKMTEEKKSVLLVDENCPGRVNDEKTKVEESVIHVKKVNSPEICEKVTGITNKELFNGKDKEELNGDDHGHLKEEQIQNGLNELTKTDSYKLLVSTKNGDDKLNTMAEEDIITDDSASTNKDEGMLSENKKFPENLDNNDAEKGIDNRIEGLEESRNTKEISSEPSAEENDIDLDDVKKEGSVESDAGSDSSSSTFPEDNKFLTSSSEDISETSGVKDENSDEEIEVDRISTSSKGSIDENTKKDGNIIREDTSSKNIKPAEIPSKIPRSVFNSGSSYKTAYGSLSRISGRRAVGAAYRTTARKRKAEEVLESTANGKRFTSPSVGSPRWKFFRPSISSLWSPRKTPFDFSVTSTPFKNVDDSMAVNIDEETMDCHLNDSDLFLEEDKTTSVRSKWGCIIM